jgi:hypothetical protein
MDGLVYSPLLERGDGDSSSLSTFQPPPVSGLCAPFASFNLARIRLFLDPNLLSHHHPPVLMAISSITTSKCPTIVTMFEPFGGSGARWSCDVNETQVASYIIIIVLLCTLAFTRRYMRSLGAPPPLRIHSDPTDLLRGRGCRPSSPERKRRSRHLGW